MNNKKRLAVFGVKFYPSQGGTSRVAESITRELKDKYEITMYCYPDQRAKSHLSGVRVIQMPKFPFGAAGVFVYYTICCLHILLSKKYDIIHAHKTDCAVFIPLLKLKGKVIATSHEAPYIRDKWNASGKAYFRTMEKIFVNAKNTVLTCVSKPLTDFYNKTYGSNVIYVPNGVDISDERNYEAAQEILDKFGIEDGYLFFAARRIMSTKGCHTFLKAMQDIGCKKTIVIAGEESHSSAYLDQLKTLSEGLNVKFIGFVNGKSTLMAMIEKASLFIFPSEIEGLSLMLLEVGCTGITPLICSDIPENTQVFGDEHVLFFQNKNSDDLAEKYLWAEENMVAMKENAKRARAHVLGEYSSEALAKRYDDLYAKMN